MKKTHRHTVFNFSFVLIHLQQIKTVHYACACSFQIDLLLGLLTVTEADTALSKSVGGQAGRKKK